MSDQSSGAGAPPQNSPSQPEAGPAGTPQVPLTVLAQYLKDLSFENPRAPGIFSSTTPPQSSATVTVNLQHLGERAYEVVLHLRIDGTVNGETAYLVELAYAGVFAVGKVANEMIEPLLMIEAPRLLFPFARNAAAVATREGGFPQVLISPIDFAGLYRSRRRPAAQAAAAAAPAQAGNA
jgi:preprotein translocase subunit SecB